MDLFGENFTECTTEHREVLGEDEDLATLDRSPTRDHTVGVRALLESGGVGSVTSQHVELLERTRIEQVVDALPGEHLPLLVLPLDGSG